MLLVEATLAFLISIQVIGCISISVTADSDTSKSTLGLLNPTPPSIFHYDDKTGISMQGPVADIFGPPVKIADGFRQLFTGSTMAGLGNSMQSNGAILNLDAHMLEAAGAGHLLKGGVLLGGSAAKVGAATVLGGMPGKKIASVVEIPVKVVALKDLAAGKIMREMGQGKARDAEQSREKGAQMAKEGDSMKQKGMNQILQGATEGVQNMGNIIQQTTNNAASAMRLLPILLDMPAKGTEEQGQQADGTKSGTSSTTTNTNKHPFSNPLNPFGGLASLFQPAVSGGGFMNGGQDPGAKLGNGFAAVVNLTHPLAGMITNPSLNPFLLPITNAAANLGPISPITQGFGNKQPIGVSGASSLGSGASGLNLFPSPLGGPHSNSFSYIPFPGVKVSETQTNQIPNLFGIKLAGQQQQQQQIEPQQQQVIKS